MSTHHHPGKHAEGEDYFQKTAHQSVLKTLEHDHKQATTPEEKKNIEEAIKEFKAGKLATNATYAFQHGKEVLCQRSGHKSTGSIDYTLHDGRLKHPIYEFRTFPPIQCTHDGQGAHHPEQYASAAVEIPELDANFHWLYMEIRMIKDASVAVLGPDKEPPIHPLRVLNDTGSNTMRIMEKDAEKIGLMTKDAQGHFHKVRNYPRWGGEAEVDTAGGKGKGLLVTLEARLLDKDFKEVIADWFEETCIVADDGPRLTGNTVRGQAYFCTAKGHTLLYVSQLKTPASVWISKH